MKKSILFFLAVFMTAGLLKGQDTPKKPAKNVLRAGAAYTQFAHNTGVTFFNELQFGICKRFSVGPNFYFSKVGYYLDNKNAITYLMGVDLNVYYSLLKSEKASLNVGPGFTFRHKDYSSVYTQPDNGFKPNTYGRAENTNKSGVVLNINYEGKITDKWSVGIKSAWQPYGMMEGLFYAGLYGGLKF